MTLFADGISPPSIDMSASAIEWTDATWNPVAGCSVMSAGCANCYAMQMARRLEIMGIDKYEGLTRLSGAGPYGRDTCARIMPPCKSRHAGGSRERCSSTP